MIHKELKDLRQKRGMTLKELASKVGYGTGNLSSYENGKLQAKDSTLIRILTRGYDMTKDEAGLKIAMWRKKELEQKYNIHLAQDIEPYNSRKKKKTLEDYLEAEGLDAETIQKIKGDIEFYKSKKN